MGSVVAQPACYTTRGSSPTFSRRACTPRVSCKSVTTTRRTSSPAKLGEKCGPDAFPRRSARGSNALRFKALRSMWVFLVPSLLGLIVGGCGTPASNEILNVSYDPTREFYKEFNEAFAKHWAKETGETVTVRMSHGGSGKQARERDRRLGGRRGHAGPGLRRRRDSPRRPACCRATGRQKLPQNSAPYTSTIVFLVRKGNPKGIKDWDDLVKPDVAVITPNPKTSGGARWNYLAAWGYVLKRELGDLAKLKDPASRRRRGEGPGEGPGVRQAAVRARAGARFRCPRLDDDLRAARHGRCAAGLGERGVSVGQRVGAGQVRDRRSVGQHSGRAVGGGRRQSVPTSTARGRWPRPI